MRHNIETRYTAQTLSNADNEAPTSSRSRMISTWPPLAAACNGVPSAFVVKIKIIIIMFQIKNEKGKIAQLQNRISCTDLVGVIHVCTAFNQQGRAVHLSLSRRHF